MWCSVRSPRVPPHVPVGRLSLRQLRSVVFSVFFLSARQTEPLLPVFRTNGSRLVSPSLPAYVPACLPACDRDGMVEELRDMSGCRNGVPLKFAVGFCGYSVIVRRSPSCAASGVPRMRGGLYF